MSKPAEKKTIVRVASEYQPMFRRIGFTPEMIFDETVVRTWRILPDRENCTWNVTDPGGETIRLHVKRYPKSTSSITPADEEAANYRLLEHHEIPTAQLVGWGNLEDSRSFILIRDLTGYEPADKIVQSAATFDKILQPTAELAADLHNSGYHHRDLYLCHFFVKFNGETAAVRLIDLARVAKLPGLLTRQRWIVKDLAQFWYSTLALPISNAQREAWLKHYAVHRNLKNVHSLQVSVARKSRSIAAHDAKLRAKSPGRNISIPKED